MQTKTKQIHLISFNCKYHEGTFYTLYIPTDGKFDTKKCLSSLRNGMAKGKSNGKERREVIIQLAKRYELNSVASIKTWGTDTDSIKDKVIELNKILGVTRENYIDYYYGKS